MPTLQMPSRMYAAIYDKMNAAAEEAGVAALRQGLMATAGGVTIEIGAGTGLNLSHYPPAVTRLVLTEPDPAMRARLAAKLDQFAPDAELHAMPAEALEFEDGCFDTAVCTTVLCTVPGQAAALAEIRRAQAGRTAALHGACPIGTSTDRAAPERGPPALLRRRKGMSPQPRHARRNRGRRVSRAIAPPRDRAEDALHGERARRGGRRATARLSDVRALDHREVGTRGRQLEVASAGTTVWEEGSGER